MDFIESMAMLSIPGAILAVWMSAKLWSESKALAILVFIFPPLGFFLMFKYAGTENDIRIPAVLSLVLAGYGYWKLTEETKKYDGMTEDQIADAMMAEFDAQQEQMIREQHGEAAAQEYSRMRSVQDGNDAALGEADESADPEQTWKRGAARLPLLTGDIPLPMTDSKLSVPGTFRFVARDPMLKLLESVGDSADAGAGTPIGWLVHNRANLTTDDPLVVAIRWHGDGHFDAGKAAQLDVGALKVKEQEAMDAINAEWEFEGGPLKFSDYLAPPQFDLGRAQLGVAKQFTQQQSGVVEFQCKVFLMLREGAIEFSIEGMPARRKELCLRSVRLAANGVVVPEKHRYHAYSSWFDQESKRSIAELLTGS